MPLIEFGGSTVVPVIAFSTCERSEKERIIRLDTYPRTRLREGALGRVVL